MDLHNFLDIESVLRAYDAILRNEAKWFLLTYSPNNDRLFLHAQGDRDLSELKHYITDLEQVYIAFYHEAGKANPGFVLINYIPASVSGVRRARALVHSRRVGGALIKTEHSTLTVDHISNVTPASIRDAVLNPDSIHTVQTNRSFSSTEVNEHMGRIRRSFTEMYAQEAKLPPAPVAKSASMFSGINSGFLRRIHKETPTPVPDDDAPPPPPPKDKGKYGLPSHPRSTSTPRSYTPLQQSIPQAIPSRRKASAPAEFLSDFAVISGSISSDEVIIESSKATAKPSATLPLDRKWVSPEITTYTFIPDPNERARRRQLLQEQRKKEEEEAIQAEAERQHRSKLEKEALLRQEQEEEERRRVSLEEELNRARMERRMREEREKEEELRKKQEIEARKRADRERRLEAHRQLEEWRREQAQRAKEEEKREEGVKKQEEAERRAKTRGKVAEVKKEIHEGQLVAGWATLQSSESLDTDQVLDELDLQSTVAAVKEWSDGFEELRAIPHSFAIEFKDGREHWGIFTDSEEEKDKLLGILYFAAGLNV
ncbi:enoyl-hydratase carnithine racemase [Moniliophthora roreri]|uniref:ADF-H domain-containing protein n=1 Tax=Moniliophthora roreri TaxID=221103 RepID=A0A0W0FI76_MONRR|nr:enoyl-hydratase carnithine racemase [Moniliophthora roreri]